MIRWMQEEWIQFRLGWKTYKLWRRILTKEERDYYHRLLFLGIEILLLGFLLGFVVGVIFPW